MAIALTELGRLLGRDLDSDDSLVRKLRDAEVVRSDVSDDELTATFARARREHAALDDEDQLFNSPEERVRVFLAPYLNAKGRGWAQT
jgi:hypothetical protein